MPTTYIPVVEDLSWKYSACAEEAPTAQDQADSVPGRRLLRSPSCAMERAPLHHSCCTWPRGISVPQLWEVHTPPKQKAGICFPTIPEPCYGRFCFLGPTFSSRPATSTEEPPDTAVLYYRSVSTPIYSWFSLCSLLLCFRCVPGPSWDCSSSCESVWSRSRCTVEVLNSS